VSRIDLRLFAAFCGEIARSCASSADAATASPLASFSANGGAVSPPFKARDPAPKAISSAVARCMVSITVRGTL
jgi:hypothetical protein